MVTPVDAENTKRMGTETYMAPEVESASTYKGVQADIFSLGVLLWIVYYGRPPFEKASENDRFYSLLQRKPDIFWRLHPTVKK